ncbi:Lysine histidine transporter 1 [Glycine soja]
MGTETRTSENPIASGNQKVAFPAAEIDKRTAEQKAIDDWLPITSSRNAKWWYSAFHNVTAMVGAGVLSLPSAMASLGWGPGVVILVLSWIITLYTLWQMVEMHEMIPGKRFDRYHELGQHAFGEKLGLWIVVPQQLICEVGLDIVYSTIAWVASVDKRVHNHIDVAVEYGYKASTSAGTVFNFLNALGDVAFAYAGHNVVLEIQATIPSSPEKPSKGPMWRGVLIAYLVVGLCYFPVALVGYWVFGNSVDDNILITLNKPTWLIVTANMFVVIHVIGSYQLYAMPVFDMIETVMVKKLHFEPSWLLRFVVRNVYVAFTMFVGITFPFFGALLGFFGGFAFAPTTYFLPCIMWLAIYKPRKFSLSWITNWICIVLGLLLMILSPIGGLRSIILNAKTYGFYQ